MAARCAGHRRPLPLDELGAVRRHGPQRRRSPSSNRPPAAVSRSLPSTGVCSRSKPKPTASSFTALKPPAKPPTPASIISAQASACLASGARRSACANSRDRPSRRASHRLSRRLNQSAASRHAAASGTQNLNTFFDLQAGHIAVEQGVVDYDNRAAAFDCSESSSASRLSGQRSLPAPALHSRSLGRT